MPDYEIPAIVPEALVKFLVQGTSNGNVIDTPLGLVKIIVSTSTWDYAVREWSEKGLFISQSELSRRRPIIFVYVMNCGKIVSLFIQHPDAAEFGSDLKKVSARLGVNVIHYGIFAKKLGYFVAFDEWADAGIHIRDLIYKRGSKLIAHYAMKPIY